MTDLTVITPTRGRPQQLARLADAIRDTTGGRVDLLALVDDDDPYRGAYVQWAAAAGMVQVLVGARGSLVSLTNVGAAIALDRPQPPTWLASLGDDHLPRTKDWDLILTGEIKRMHGPGWAYGNDLLQGRALPTAWVQHAATVRALGWMMLPTLGHMYPDNVVFDLGNTTGRLAYAPGVIIEHLHPAAGKAQVDESYAESNARERYDTDRRAYTAWQQQRMHDDQAAVAALTWAVVPC